MEQVESTRYRPSAVRIVVKAILFIIVKIFIGITSFWRRYPLPALTLLVMIVGSIFMLATGTIALPGSPAAAPVEDARISVEAYLRGQKDFNADMMWGAMDEQLKATLQQRGQSLQELKQQQLQRQQSGIKLAHHHVAGTDLSDGRKVFLYIVTVSQGQQTQELPYTFTVNKAGKIVNID
jgi:hypothetical protein